VENDSKEDKQQETRTLEITIEDVKKVLKTA